jgi:hypothetical protein
VTGRGARRVCLYQGPMKLGLCQLGRGDIEGSWLEQDWARCHSVLGECKLMK